METLAWSPPDPWPEQSSCLNQRNLVPFETFNTSWLVMF